MSGLSQLMSGADCGPSNPLQGLTKNFDRDRSLTQDVSTSRAAGPSRGVFRTVVQNRQLDDQAAAFFSQQPTSPGSGPAPGPQLQQAWNMSPMLHSLPQQGVGRGMPVSGGWVQDFTRPTPPPAPGPAYAPPPALVQLPQHQPTARVQAKRAEVAPGWAQDFGRAFAQAERTATPPQQQQQPVQPLRGLFGGSVPMQYAPGTVWRPEDIIPRPLMPVSAQVWTPPQPTTLPVPVQEQTPAPQPTQEEAPQQQQQQRDTVLEADDLAATASLLLESVRTETNPKFKNSAFMSLMHQFKDRTAVVEGNDIVEVSPGHGLGQLKNGANAQGRQEEGETSSTSTSASLSSAWARGEDVRGQRASSNRPSGSGTSGLGQSSTLAQANVHDSQAWQSEPGVSAALSGIDPTWAQWADLMPQVPSQPSGTFGNRAGRKPLVGVGAGVDMRAGTEMFPETLQMDEEDWHEYQAQMGAGEEEMDRAREARARSVRFEPESSFQAQEREWNTLQNQWEEFEVENVDIRPTEAYRFQEENPYYAGQAGYTSRTHALHTASDWAHLAAETVLEKEAAVQRDPTSALAWYELGVRQQENEREQKAIQALRKAVSLDEGYIDAWLALAVSLVNEGDRRAAYDAIESWISRNPRYANTPKPSSATPSNTQTMAQRQELLMQQLIAMALDVPEGEIDADVQVALGVLFNINEEYGKAIDCFHAAVSVRQEDWQLYNRIGASYANSGDPEKALEYYRHALQLNPGYIRARYNLGIAEIGLKHYTEAAQNILDALVLQESEANTYRSSDDPGVSGAKGVTNSALWFGLRNASAKMRRPDLVTLCDQQDLEAYRVFFAPLPSQVQAESAFEVD